MKLVGYEARSGTFTDRESGKQIDYDNYFLHFLHPFETADGKGFETSTLKVKRDEFERLAGCYSPENLLDKEVELVHRYRQDKAVLKAIIAV